MSYRIISFLYFVNREFNQNINGGQSVPALERMFAVAMNLLFVSLRSFMFFCLHKHLAVCNERINLSDDEWRINCYGLNISIPANVPGSVYTALIDNEIIKDPYFETRDDTYAWIADKSWSYRTEFKGKNLFCDVLPV